VSEPQDRPRDDGGAPQDPDAVAPWDPARAAGAARQDDGGRQEPGGPPPGPVTPPPRHPGKVQDPGAPPPRQPGTVQDPWGFGGPVAAPRPGIVPLRPLTLGERLDGAFRYIRAHPRVVLGVSTVVAVVTVLIEWPFRSAFGASAPGLVSAGQSSPPRLDQIGAVLGGGFALLGVELLVNLLANTVLTGLLVVVLSRSVLGAPIVARDCWNAARPRLPGLLGVVVLVAALTLVAAFAPEIPGLLVLLAGGPAGAAAGLLVLGVLAGIVLAVLVAVGLALAAPAYVLEGGTVVAALRRSRTLVTGRFWPILGTLLLTALIVVAATVLVGVPFRALAAGVGQATGGGTDLSAPPAVLLTEIGTVVAAALTTPFQAGVTGLIYIDQRMRRERFDVELQRAARGQG
jgi:hypothetical protein